MKASRRELGIGLSWPHNPSDPPTSQELQETDRSCPAPLYRRERWTTPDQDFIDVDFSLEPPDDGRLRPMLVMNEGEAFAFQTNTIIKKETLSCTCWRLF